jgi:archaellum component FlaC
MEITREELEQLMDGLKQHINQRVEGVQQAVINRDEQIYAEFSEEMQRQRVEFQREMQRQREENSSRFDQLETGYQQLGKSVEQLAGEVMYFREWVGNMTQTIHLLTHDVYRLQKDRHYLHLADHQK